MLMALVALAGMAQVTRHEVKVGNFSRLALIDNINVNYRCNADSAGLAVLTCTQDIADHIMFSLSSKGQLSIQVVDEYERTGDLPQADVDSCAADTFSEFYIHLDRYDPSRCSVKTWLCVIAKNVSSNSCRKALKERPGLSADLSETLDAADDFSLEGEFISKEERRDLIEAVNRLNEPDRQIIVRKYYLGQSTKQVAEKLGLTVSNVDTRTHRAVKKLKTLFGGAENE